MYFSLTAWVSRVREISTSRPLSAPPPQLKMSGSALQALLASIGFAEIPPDADIEAQLRKLFVYYCSFGDIGALCRAHRRPYRSPATAFSVETRVCP